MVAPSASAVGVTASVLPVHAGPKPAQQTNCGLQRVIHEHAWQAFTIHWCKLPVCDTRIHSLVGTPDLNTSELRIKEIDVSPSQPQPVRARRRGMSSSNGNPGTGVISGFGRRQKPVDSGNTALGKGFDLMEDDPGSRKKVVIDG